MSLMRAFVRRDLQKAWSYKLALVTQLVGRASTLFVFFFLGRAVGQLESLAAFGGDYFSFAVIGLALQEPAYAALASPSSKLRAAQLDGTLERLFSTSTHPRTVTLLGALGPVLSATMRGMFILLGGVLLGAEIVFSVEAFLPVALLIAATLSLGLIAAGVTLVVKRGEPISASVHVINGLLAGVLYPVSVLPTWLQTIADWVPLTHALALLRSAILPQTTSPPSHHLAVLAAMTAVLSVLAVLFFSRALTRAKRKGTLSHY